MKALPICISLILLAPVSVVAQEHHGQGHGGGVRPAAPHAAPMSHGGGGFRVEPRGGGGAHMTSPYTGHAGGGEHIVPHAAMHHAHGGVFHYPRGYSYHRYARGGFLPGVFIGSAFLGYSVFGLPAPAPGYIWVRYGPDLIEVNQLTGEIVYVEYGVFY